MRPEAIRRFRRIELESRSENNPRSWLRCIAHNRDEDYRCVESANGVQRRDGENSKVDANAVSPKSQ